MQAPRLYRRHRPVRGVGLTLVLLAAIIAGVVWFDRTIYAPIKSFTGYSIPAPTAIPTPPPAPTPAGSQAAAASTSSSDPTPTPAPPPTATPLPSITGSKRINVLLLGSDTDAKFKGNFITQIMIVASIDPVNHTVTLLSIPRDFWVPIPGHGIGKIQIAYQYGEQDHPNGGGVALARQTVEDDFGIRIDHWAWIGLEGFIKVIDTAGGVDVDVLHPILDDNYPDDLSNGKVTTTDIYASRRLYIPAGPQHLDGPTALEYVRSRHADLIGDFGRSQRQQQVLLKLRQKIAQPGTLLRIPEYLSDLNGYVKSDFSVSELLAYGNFLRQHSSLPITQVVLMPPAYSSLGVSNDGLMQDIVVPDWPAVHGLIAHDFAEPTAAAPPAAAASGNARIAVENGTTIGGLATSAVTSLRTLGYTVDPAQDASASNYTRSVVTVYNPAKQRVAELIAPMFDAEIVRAPEGGRHGADDLVVTLGTAHGTFEGF